MVREFLRSVGGEHSETIETKEVESNAVRDNSRKRITALLKPLIEMDAFGVFPGGAGHVVQMPGEDLRVCVGQQGRGFCGSSFLVFGGVLRFRNLFSFFDPAGFEGGPVDLLEIEVVQAVDFFRIGGASGLELRREMALTRTSREEVADGFVTRGTDNKSGVTAR